MKIIPSLNNFKNDKGLRTHVNPMEPFRVASEYPGICMKSPHAIWVTLVCSWIVFGSHPQPKFYFKIRFVRALLDLNRSDVGSANIHAN